MLLTNPASGITCGRKTVAAAGTAEALSTSNAQVLSVVIQAETDNTGDIVVGASDVVAAQATRKGVCLAAGQSIALNIHQLSAIYLDTTVNGDGVTYLALDR